MLRNIRLYLLVIIGLTWSTNASKKNDENFQTVHTSNEAIFNRLGLSPLEISDGHYKKRLAGPEPSSLVNLQTRINQPYNRRHGDRDSHVYIVKLPASQPYYTITKPHKKLINDNKNNNNENSNINNEKSSPILINHEIPTVSFNSNGKTAKIYHWNLPLMKKINEKKRHNELFKIQQMKKKLTFDKKQLTQESQKLLNTNNVNILFDDKLPLIKKHARNNDKRLNYPSKNNLKINNKLFDNNYNKNNNDTQKKMLRLDDSTFYNIKTNNNNKNIENFFNDFNSVKNIESFETKKHRKKAAMSYYAPNIHKTGSTSIHKNFSGNGKPKAFYVMEKSRKPVYYHPLLPYN